MGHDHHHHGTQRALIFALVLNAGFMVVELVGGWWTGSLALLSDAAHMMGDVAALLLALGAARLAERAASTAATFGFRRAETLGAFVNGLALLAIAIFIVLEASHRLMEGPPEVLAGPMLVVAAIGLVVNLVSAFVLMRGGHDNLNMRAAMVHMMADALGSVGAIAAGILMLMGYPSADAMISVLLAGLVLWGSVGILRDSSHVLLQLPPPGLDLARVHKALNQLDGVKGVHDLHAWTLGGHDAIVTAHLVAAEPSLVDPVRIAATKLLQDQFDVTHATLQLECDGACAMSECGANGVVLPPDVHVH